MLKCQGNLASSLLLYAVTDNHWLERGELTDAVVRAIEGGTTFVQLRDKQATTQQRIEQGRKLLAVCRKLDVPFVINDDVEAALAVGADGVHVGQDDCSCLIARSMLGPTAIVGVSASNVEQALEAQADGADYLGVGAVFSTTTKTDADSVTPELLRDITAAVDIPVVAIGGITANNIHALKNTGIVGVSVVSALFGARDITMAARALHEAVLQLGGEPL